MSDNLNVVFDELCKEIIFPVLKDAGFKRKGLNFFRRINDLVQTLNIQKSVWNDSDESIKFTINIGFYHEDILPQYLKINYDYPKVTESFIQTRLGQLTHKNDYWYEINSISEKSTLEERSKNDIIASLLPFLDTNNSLLKLNNIIEKRSSGILITPFFYLLFLIKIGKKDKASIVLQEEYQTALNPKDTTHTVNFPNGRQDVFVIKAEINKDYIVRLEQLAKDNGLNISEYV